MDITGDHGYFSNCELLRRQGNLADIGSLVALEDITPRQQEVTTEVYEDVRFAAACLNH